MRTVLIALLTTGAALAEERPYPELYCTDGRGARVELGGVTCIAAGCAPAYLARCEMSLNNVMWRKVHEGCPAVALEPAPAVRETRAPS